MGDGAPPADGARPDDAQLRWIVRLGSLLVRLLAHTWRIRIVGDEGFRAVRATGQPVIFTLWHGHLLPLLWQHRNEGIAILISEHRDGEIIARVAEGMGCRTVRGSTTRGGGRALIGLVRSLREGHDIAVTPDGPRGPARVFAPGALVASQRGDAPILPLAAAASGGWRLRSWDRFLIPYPFARVVVAYGPLTHVRGESPRDAAAEAPRFQALLDETARVAEEAVR